MEQLNHYRLLIDRWSQTDLFSNGDYLMINSVLLSSMAPQIYWKKGLKEDLMQVEVQMNRLLCKQELPALFESWNDHYLSRTTDLFVFSFLIITPQLQKRRELSGCHDTEK